MRLVSISLFIYMKGLHYNKFKLSKVIFINMKGIRHIIMSINIMNSVILQIKEIGEEDLTKKQKKGKKKKISAGPCSSNHFMRRA